MRLDTPDSGSYTVEIQIVIVNQWIDEIKWIYIYLHFFIGMRAAIISVHLYYYYYIYIYRINHKHMSDIDGDKHISDIGAG